MGFRMAPGFGVLQPCGLGASELTWPRQPCWKASVSLTPSPPPCPEDLLSVPAFGLTLHATVDTSL